jgi:hypothetical protein
MGNLLAMDANSGEILWRHSLGTVGKGSPIWVDGKIFVGEVNGRFHSLRPSRKGCEILSRLEWKAPDGHIVEIFGSPALGRGRLYFTTIDDIYCYGKKTWNGVNAPAVEIAKEPALDAGAQPAAALVDPAEVLICPGGHAGFRVRLYNQKGQWIRFAKKVDWTLKGLKGDLDLDPGDGFAATGFKAATNPAFQFGLLEAKADGITASARIRVAPAPDSTFEENFDAIPLDKLPVGWIGMSPLKFKMVDLDGGRVLMKHGTRYEIKFTRAYVYLGPASMKNYTIQADLRGNLKRRSAPDMGLINQRYELNFQGAFNADKRTLRLISWTAERRVMKEIPFPWQVDVWYTAKLRVEPQGGKGLILGKVWKRGDPEPQEWTVTLEDPMPNSEGSPGILAFSNGTTQTSPGTDAFFDNVKVYPNP